MYKTGSLQILFCLTPVLKYPLELTSVVLTVLTLDLFHKKR